MSQPKVSDDDLLFDQAYDMLWSPMVGPDLRSALFHVLASTPGVVVNTHATDSVGRPAVEISRVSTVAGDTLAVFENPATARVLEETDTFPANKSTGEARTVYGDLYLSITRTNTLPVNPYHG